MADPALTALLYWEVDVIRALQTRFKESRDLMLFLTKLGDPRFAFLVAFPLTFFLSKRVGVQVMWMAAVSEWLNGILKWLLHGHRPYWWVHEPGLYEDVPHLEQFYLTCETGPGSPSGHAMVTSAVWFVIINEFNTSTKKHRFFWSFISWSFFVSLVLSVMISRCFIATHFPHQVMLGAVTGITLGKSISHLFTLELTLKAYIIGSVALVSSALLIHWFLEVAVGGTSWSIVFAEEWCAKKEWIHLDTTPYFALTRDVSSLLGLGVALQLMKQQEDTNRFLRRRIGEVLIAIGIAIVVESTHLPQESLPLFYFLALLKWTLLPCLLLTVVPMIAHFLDRTSTYEMQNKKI